MLHYYHLLLLYIVSKQIKEKYKNKKLEEK